jgi:hypothetical protein
MTSIESRLPSKPGRCFVCNEETFLRCNECLKHGTDYIYFCGIEHKKLVRDAFSLNYIESSFSLTFDLKGFPHSQASLWRTLSTVSISGSIDRRVQSRARNDKETKGKREICRRRNENLLRKSRFQDVPSAGGPSSCS